MSDLTYQLTSAERTVLAECERRIERGLATFVEVGTALATIRDNRLYREQFQTFEDYCQERWGFTRQRAHQITSAAEIALTIVDTGLPSPANEGQARELARIPEGQRAEVWRETVERTGGRPDSPQLALFDIGGTVQAGARRFPYIPRLRFRDEAGEHRLMLRDWGVYELMRKHNNLTQMTDAERCRYVGQALHLDPSCSLLVGNLNSRRTAWLVISVLRGLRAAPSLFDTAELAA